MVQVWRVLYESGADVIINGHDHDYERFAPQNPDGKSDPRGIREFVVGTGGGGLYNFKAIRPNSEARGNRSSTACSSSCFAAPITAGNS